jgi:hypothetical protein
MIHLLKADGWTQMNAVHRGAKVPALKEQSPSG